MTSFTCSVRFQRWTLANLVGSMWKSDNDKDHAMLIALGIKSFISPFYRELKKNDIFTICWLFYFFFRQCIFYKFTLIKWMKRIQRFSGIICLTSFHEKNTIHCFFTLFLSWIDHIFLMAFYFICNELIARCWWKKCEW